MQVIVFIILVFVTAVSILDPIEALFFSLSVLAFIIFGQMLIGAIILIIDTYLFELFNKSKSQKLDTYLSQRLSKSILINRIVVFMIVLIMSYMYSPALILPAIVGIVYWIVVEFLGESKFQLK